ncbi:MAG: META domain-containing protein [Bacteroidota bacterium]
MRLVALALLTTVFLAGCGRAPTGLAAELPGTTWTLERVVLADGSVLRGSDDQMTFGPDGGLTLSSCNTCNGRFRLRGDDLRLDDAMVCTKRACMDGQVELERYLTGHLTLRMDGQYLVAEPADEMAAATQVLFLPGDAR